MPVMQHKRFVQSVGFVLCAVTSSQGAHNWVYKDHTLDNGMRVIVMEDHSAPIVAVQVWYHVGSKDEDPARNGFAHMFEHMMFRGTERIGPEDHFKYLRRFGGAVNGYTTFDTTVYIEEVPPNQVDLTFWLEAERLANLKINEEYFAKEREVVKEEYRLRVSDPPYGRVFENALSLAFTKHPYRWSTIGNLDHLNAATADELRTFFDTYYVPNNATLVVVGDVKTDDILAKAKRYFGWIPRGSDPPRVTTREPTVTTPRRRDVYDKGPVTVVAIGYHGPGLRNPDRHAMNILDTILSGESGRLYQKLVKELDISVGAQSMYWALEQGAIWGIGSAVKPFGSVDANRDALEGILDDIKNNGVTEDELIKARNQALAEAAQSRATCAGKARRLGTAAVVEGDVDQVNRELDDLMQVSAADIQRAAATYLADDRRLTLTVKPKLAQVGDALKNLVGKKTPPAATQPTQKDKK
jgi:predicted Zn-dependent peptidase